MVTFHARVKKERMINVVRSMEDRVQGQSFGSKESSKLENFSRTGIEHAFEASCYRSSSRCENDGWP